MGENATPSAASKELLRAGALQDAQEGLASPAVHPGSAPAKSAPPANGHSEDSAPYFEKAYLEQVFENAPEAISILDPDMQVTRINKEFTRLYGFAPSEALGQTIQALIVPPDRYAETAWISESIRTASAFRRTIRRCVRSSACRCTSAS